jgi:hypothetical protein
MAEADWADRETLGLIRSFPVQVDDLTRVVLETLRRLIGQQRDDTCDAKQTAIASFTRYGFDAAVAIAGRPMSSGGAPAPGQATGFRGLPLFSGWVADPQEPEDRPPAS